MAGGPNPAAGRRLIDFLLGPGVEARLAAMRSIQIPLNPAVETPQNVPALSEIHTMNVTFEAIAAEMETTAARIQKEFLR